MSYGFARFNFRGKNLLFVILIGTIVLPVQATLIPTYVLFSKIGWTNTFLPLIIPHFFANGYNVFLLRQYFMQLPRELDEAAMIDGANPIQVLLNIIIPAIRPGDHRGLACSTSSSPGTISSCPLVYLASPEICGRSRSGLQYYNAIYGRVPNLI